MWAGPCGCSAMFPYAACFCQLEAPLLHPPTSFIGTTTAGFGAVLIDRPEAAKRCGQLTQPAGNRSGTEVSPVLGCWLVVLAQTSQ